MSKIYNSLVKKQGMFKKNECAISKELTFMQKNKVHIIFHKPISIVFSQMCAANCENMQ